MSWDTSRQRTRVSQGVSTRAPYRPKPTRGQAPAVAPASEYALCWRGEETSSSQAWSWALGEITSFPPSVWCEKPLRTSIRVCLPGLQPLGLCRGQRPVWLAFGTTTCVLSTPTGNNDPKDTRLARRAHAVLQNPLGWGTFHSLKKCIFPTRLGWLSG